METALAVHSSRSHGALARNLETAANEARQTFTDARAEETGRVYRIAWAHFAGWCEAHELEPLPADPRTVVLYLNGCAFPAGTDPSADPDEGGATPARGCAVSTLSQRLAAIRLEHRRAGCESPTAAPIISETMRGIRRRLAGADRRPEGKRALALDELTRMIGGCAQDAGGRRDRAILAVGFIGAFRRSELAGLNLEDVTFGPEGATIQVRRSKTDQEGKGMFKVIPVRRGAVWCPVVALRDWLGTRGDHPGPLFVGMRRNGKPGRARLSARHIARLVQRAAYDAGLSDTDKLGAHSLRVGFVTEARRRGASVAEIMHQTGHRTSAMVDHYTRAASAWDMNAAVRL